MRHLPFMPDLGSFPAGTRISTTMGEMPVEEVAPGSRLVTPGGENITVTGVTSRVVRLAVGSRRGKPVLIPAGSLGGGLPARDMVLPPFQLVGIADLSPVDLFGRVDVLVPAASLAALPGARVMRGRRVMTLYSIKADRPCLIYAEGAVTETTRSLWSRIVLALTRGLLGGRVHRRAGIRVLSEGAGRRLVGRLRKSGDLPDRPPGKRANDLLQWDLDLAAERIAGERPDADAPRPAIAGAAGIGPADAGASDAGSLDAKSPARKAG